MTNKRHPENRLRRADAPQRPRIALLVESSRAYGRGLLRGIAEYTRKYGPWFLCHEERSLGDPAPIQVESWGASGILARIESRQLRDQIEQMGVPTVDLLGKYRIDSIPVVRPDDRQVTRVAFEYLRERQFTRFAYCGFLGVYYSDLRGKYFVEHVREAGCEPHVYLGPRPRHGTHIATIEKLSLLRMNELAAWLRSLPKPIGLVACNDLRAQQALNACSSEGISVPEEVAVLGVDNDELVCELSTPMLSSVRLDARKTGFEAAALLDRMMQSRKPPPERILIESPGVVARQSSNVEMIADADVVAALSYIRVRACDGISVEDICRHVQLSHSTLVRRFAKVLGHTPKAEIHRVQIDRVRELLSTTDSPLSEITALAGFNYVENMCKLFKQKTSSTPGQYRRTSRTPSSG